MKQQQLQAVVAAVQVVGVRPHPMPVVAVGVRPQLMALQVVAAAVQVVTGFLTEWLHKRK